MTERLRRLHVIKNATRQGVVIPFNQSSLTELKNDIADELRMNRVNFLFNPHGCEVIDFDLIRDDDVLIASASQHFEKPGKKKPAETAMYTLLKEVLKMALKMLIDTVRGPLLAQIASA